MILAAAAVRDLARELEAIVGGDHLIVDDEAQKRFLRDFSWYSPLLTTSMPISAWRRTTSATEFFRQLS